jgi:ABC-2 type transport system permease protein
MTDAVRRARGAPIPPALLQMAQLARRSVVRTLRQPAQIVPALVFPLFLLAVNSNGLADAIHLPGFPTHSYLTFALAVPFMQGALFAALNAGTDIANDVESGFFNRLALTPLRGVALLAGMLGGAVLLGVVQAITFLTVGLVAGAGLAAGPGGVVVILALSITMSVGFGALGAFVALRTGSGEAVQGMFPLFFVLLFLSSMALPRDLIQTDWFRQVATYNPVSYLIEGIRSVLVTGWDGEALALGFAVAAGVVVVGLLAASLALRTRLVRT